MTVFEPAKALREEISSLNDVRTSLLHRERSLERAYTEMEVELNAVRKLRSFADAEINRKRIVLACLT